MIINKIKFSTMERNTSSLKCEICYKLFSCQSSRNRHVREQHLQPGLFRCKQCASSFSKKYNLQVHIKNVHSKNLKGMKCERTYNKLATLKKHNKFLLDGYDATLYSSTSLEIDKETDAQTLAESVLKELKQLQKDIQPSEKILSENSGTKLNNDYEKTTIEVISIRDNLYPLGHFTLVKAQRTQHTDGTVYLKCEVCSKEFKKTFNYLRHRRIHTKVRPFVCILCNKSFPTTDQLKAHCSMHKLDEKLGVFHKLYKCPGCGKCFSAMKQLDKHFRSISPCNAIFECSHCLKFYKTLKTLSSHKHFKKDDDLEILNKLLPSPIPLFEKVKNVYECNISRMHVNDSILQTRRKSHCPFVSQSALMIHTKDYVNSNHFKCQYCNKCFRTPQSCRRHMLTHIKQLLHTREILQDEENTLCLYPTLIKNRKGGHIKTMTSIIKSSKKYKTEEESSSTSKELKYKCLKCEKSFCYKSWMKKHFKYKHSEELNFECSICFKRFRTKQSFQHHILIHSAERTKATCQVCGKQYASSKSLKIHLRIHTQEKPFQCNNCCKSFRTSGHLIQHRKVNHKESS